MSPELPTRPHLDHLKRQAKRLLRSLRAGDAEAVERFTTHVHRLRDPDADPPALGDAQLVVAREYGFDSWAALKTRVEELRLVAEPDRFPHVGVLRRRFTRVFGDDADGVPIRTLLAGQAEALLEDHRAGRAEALAEIGNHFQPLIGRSTEEILAADFSLEDARETLALEHGYDGWEAVEALGDESPDAAFEDAADAVVDGDLATLEVLLHERPELATARSRYRHRATLLHYVAANGVEIIRQRSPANAAAIARALLAAGAEVDALADTYGGGPDNTTLCLLVSSAHPAEAGVQVELVHVLADAGARLNGLNDDGRPLSTALAFGYLPAARALVKRGARIDRVDPATVPGGLDRLRELLEDE